MTLMLGSIVLAVHPETPLWHFLALPVPRNATDTSTFCVIVAEGLSQIIFMEDTHTPWRCARLERLWCNHISHQIKPPALPALLGITRVWVALQKRRGRGRPSAGRAITWQLPAAVEAAISEQRTFPPCQVSHQSPGLAIIMPYGWRRCIAALKCTLRKAVLRLKILQGWQVAGKSCKLQAYPNRPRGVRKTRTSRSWAGSAPRLSQIWLAALPRRSPRALPRPTSMCARLLTSMH